MNLHWKTPSIIFTGLLLCNQIAFAASVYYGLQAGTDDGVYKVDMDTGGITKIHSGTFTLGMTAFGADKIIVTDYSQQKISIIHTDGSIYKEFATPVVPHFAVQDPNDLQTIIYSSYVSNQVRLLDVDTESDTFLASYSYANKIGVKPDGTSYISLWLPSGGGHLYNIDTGAFVAGTDWITSIISDPAGNFYFTGHPAWSYNVIYKLDTANSLTTLYSGAEFLSGVAYDEENNRLLSFADEGGAGIALYSFGLDGAMTKLLTGLSLPHHIDPFSGGYAYTLYLNAESSSAVPEPATLLLLLVSGIGMAVKRVIR